MALLHPVLFYDGGCALCHRSVRFLLHHDRHDRLRFASLQSEMGQQHVLMAEKEAHETVLFFKKGQYYSKSSAVLRAMIELGGIWRLCSIGFLCPRLIRDALYNFVSRRRFRWFGTADQCTVPDAAYRHRFLDL